ncbi:MAG: DAK2 domain-containing protein [Ruminococcaceae bacterium]|nr:DAK2 domain-containing protein [Oscillospiraceae bacterium]
MTKMIDASLLSNMIISGAYNLSNNRELVDALNVFPVPDGDTGTNMSLTFINAARSVENTNSTDVAEVANTVAKATLRGARGNSGVILSQIFRGISKKIDSNQGIDVATMKAALRGGCDTAYHAVMKPTEGTILTVIRSAAEAAELYEGEEIPELMRAVYDGMSKALAQTQQMLPQLKQAGVVDAGGQGLVFIFEGFLSAINGTVIPLNDSSSFASTAKAPAQSTISTEDIKFAYCTEFIINKYNAKHTADKMRAAIEPKGDCMIVIDEDDIVKVHIHTNHPGYVLEQAVKLGEMVNIKIENMREQHTDILGNSENKASDKPTQHRKTAVVAVANGDGLIETFKELGVTNIIHGGQTMNPSTEDILNAVEEANADNVFVLPNNKNIILAAQQAAEIADCNVIVIETKTIPQGICAMMDFSPDAQPEENTQNMNDAIENVVSGNVTHAVKDTEIDGMEIHEGNIIGVSSGHILSAEEDIFTATVSLVKQIADEDSEIITLYYGEGETEDTAQKIADAVEEIFPDADILVANGGQSVYYYIVSVE